MWVQWYDNRGSKKINNSLSRQGGEWKTGIQGFHRAVKLFVTTLEHWDSRYTQYALVKNHSRSKKDGFWEVIESLRILNSPMN